MPRSRSLAMISGLHDSSKGLHPVPHETVRLPDPLHRAHADPGGSRHRPGRPSGLSRPAWPRVGSTHSLHGRGWQRRRAGASWCCRAGGRPPPQRRTVPATPDTTLGQPGVSISAVPQTSAVVWMILARRTRFCGRSAMTVSRRAWSVAETWMLIPSHLPPASHCPGRRESSVSVSPLRQQGLGPMSWPRRRSS
jgi:hypothetical protein